MNTRKKGEWKSYLIQRSNLILKVTQKLKLNAADSIHSTDLVPFFPSSSTNSKLSFSGNISLIIKPIYIFILIFFGSL
jgi:hypothetical protein